MALLDSILSPVTDLVGSILKRIWPNKELAQQHTHDEAMGQQATNTAQAQHHSLFVAGARAFIMWGCGFSVVWQFVVRPLLIGLFPGRNFPGYSTEEMTMLGRILLGMLGLGV